MFIFLLFSLIMNGHSQTRSREQTYEYWDFKIQEHQLKEDNASAPLLLELISKSGATASKTATKMMKLIQRDQRHQIVNESAQFYRDSRGCRKNGRPVPGVPDASCGFFQFKYGLTFDLDGGRHTFVVQGVGHYLTSTGELAGAEVDHVGVTCAEHLKCD